MKLRRTCIHMALACSLATSALSQTTLGVGVGAGLALKAKSKEMRYFGGGLMVGGICMLPSAIFFLPGLLALLLGTNKNNLSFLSVQDTADLNTILADGIDVEARVTGLLEQSNYSEVEKQAVLKAALN